MTEENRLTGDFKNIAKAINKIALVEEVILYNENCKKIFSIPLNAQKKSLCHSEHKQSDWIIYNINDSFSKLKIILVKILPPIHQWPARKITYLLLLIIIFSILNSLLSVFFLRNYFKGRFQDIVFSILDMSPSQKKKNNDFPIELIPLKNSLLQAKKQIIKYQDEIIQQKEKQATAEICLQIAHDIRAPIPIINNFIEKRINKENEKEIKLLQMATTRISDIAEELLQKKDFLLGEKTRKEKKNINLIQLIKNLIIEKESILLNRKIKIIFNKEINHFSYHLYPKSFSRALSNLIQNSIESIEEEGEIKVSLNIFKEKVQIEIKDSGTGISKENLSKIRKKGVSIGKQNGSGLGLSYSIKIIQDLNGNLFLNSKKNIGTTVKIELPLTHPSIKPIGKNYVLIDDDNLIRLSWENSAIRNKINFRSYPSLKDFYKDINNLSSNTIICLDSQLEGEIQGEEAAKDIYHRGFTEIFLATGMDPQFITKQKWIKGILGKEPIWEVDRK